MGNNYFSPEESIASDLYGEMARLYFEQRIPFRQKLVRSRGEDESGMVDYVIEAARENWNKYYEGEEPVSNYDRDSYLEACRWYMIHGAKLANRRFGSGILANTLFNQIQDTVGEGLLNLEYEGQEFTIGYDFRGNVRFHEVYPEEY